MKYFFVLILTSLPFLSWIGQYYFSKKHSLHESFKKHWTCYRGDWLFVIINVLFLFSVKISVAILYLFSISILINLYTHYKWGKENKIGKIVCHFFFRNTDQLNKSGIVHFIFSTIQMTLIISILILESIRPFIYFELFFVFAFGMFIPYGAYRINSKITWLDITGALIIFILIILRIIFLV